MKGGARGAQFSQDLRTYSDVQYFKRMCLIYIFKYVEYFVFCISNTTVTSYFVSVFEMHSNIVFSILNTILECGLRHCDLMNFDNQSNSHRIEVESKSNQKRIVIIVTAALGNCGSTAADEIFALPVTSTPAVKRQQANVACGCVHL